MTLLDVKPKNLGVILIGIVMILIPMQWMADPSLGMAGSRITQQQMYQVAGIAVFAIFILQNILLSAFLLWTTFLYIHFGFANPVGTLLLTLLTGFMIYEAVYRVVEENNVEILYGCMIGFMLLNLFYMVMQGFGWELLFKEFTRPGFQNQMVGFMGLKAIMGMFFAMCIPFLAFKYHKLSLGLFIPLYVSECSAAMIAGIVAYLWQIWFISKKAFYIMTAILLIGGSAYAYNDSHAGMFTDRANMWKVVLRDAVKHPVIGWGPDSFRSVTPDKQFLYWKNNITLETSQIDVKDTIEQQTTGKYDIKKYSFMKPGDSINPWDNPHNEYVQLFYEFGLIGLIIFGFLIYDIKRRFEASNELLTPLVGFFLAVLIMSIGQFPFHLARVGLYIPIFLACYYKLTDIYA